MNARRAEIEEARTLAATLVLRQAVYLVRQGVMPSVDKALDLSNAERLAMVMVVEAQSGEIGPMHPDAREP